MCVYLIFLKIFKLSLDNIKTEIGNNAQPRGKHYIEYVEKMDKCLKLQDINLVQKTHTYRLLLQNKFRK